MSAPSQHMGTLSKRRFNKRVALAELERNSIKNILAPMQDLNKINNNNEFEESASKTFFWKSTEKMKE